MAEDQTDGRLVPERRLPEPLSVSPEARASLATVTKVDASPLPALDDKAGWRKHVADRNEAILKLLGPRLGAVGVAGVPDTISGVPVFRVTPPGVATDDRRVYLDFHGGALVYLGGEGARLMAGGTALRVGAPVVSVDYRMPPDGPYPAGIDDGVAVYRSLLESYRPEQIVVGGSSAGGNIAAATVLRARDEGLPLPAGLVLLSPEIDLTEIGDSFNVMAGVDHMLTGRMMPLNLLYADGAALDHPYVSPLYGDFTKGFPRTFLQSGTRDLLLSNTVLMHRALRKADVPAELHVFEAMPHGGFGGAPEDGDLTAEVRKFLALCWG